MTRPRGSLLPTTGIRRAAPGADRMVPASSSRPSRRVRWRLRRDTAPRGPGSTLADRSQRVLEQQFQLLIVHDVLTRGR